MYSLEAKIRTDDARTTRRSGRVIPAVVYGKDVPSTMVTVRISEFIKVYRETGQAQIIELNVDKKKYNVLVQEAQRHPVTGDFLHLDFINVDMKKEIEVETPIEVIGTAPAVTEGASLHQVIYTLTVRCLPTDIAEAIEVDISGLKEVGDSISVADVQVPKTLTVLNDPEEVIVNTFIAKTVEEEPADTEEGSEEGAEEGDATSDDSTEEKSAE